MAKEITVDDINVTTYHSLMSPSEAHQRIPMTDRLAAFVEQSRQTIVDILDGNDDRLILIVGPCSVHDPVLAMDYAYRLAKLAKEVEDTLFIIMRVYFEKPRSTTGWKGLINDPNLDGTFEIESGLHTARALLKQVSRIGLPIGTEALDPIVPQYLQDFVSWTAIGARTTESQTHREMASGLSSPVGFKNGTDGNVDVAINAIKSAAFPHSFLGVDDHGRVSIVKTKGNKHAHVVLRGGNNPNYDAAAIRACENKLIDGGVCPKIVVDCSHGNSRKDHNNQPAVAADVIGQVIDGNRSIRGLMIESNILADNQPFTCNRKELLYGVSITDKCIDFPTTATLVLDMHAKLQEAKIAQAVRTAALA